MFTQAAIDIKMTDWIAFAVQYAFSNVMFASLVIVVTLALILGIAAALWGRLWNSKWGPFKSLLDMAVCTVIALLFALCSLILHGLSENNFGFGTKDIAFATYQKPKDNGESLLKVLFTTRTINDGSGEKVVVVPADTLKGKDGAGICEDIAVNIAKRWGDGQTTPELITAFLKTALLHDTNLTDICEELATGKDKPQVVSRNRDKLKDWNTELHKTAATVMTSYNETINFLFAFWWILLITMILYVAWRAYTNIKNHPVALGLEPSADVMAWVNETDESEEQKN